MAEGKQLWGRGKGSAGGLGAQSWKCLIDLSVEKLSDHSCLYEFRG